jgi:serine phosphatase RsbU (regulator of sigma subunit)
MLIKRFVVIFIYGLLSLPVRTQTLVDSLVAIVNKENQDSLTVKAYIGLCEFYYEKGDYEKVIDYSAASRKISEAINYKKGTLQSIFQRSKVFRTQGKPDQAMRLCMEGLKLAEKINDIGIEARFYFQMGQIFENQKNYKNALTYYKNAFEIAKKKNIDGIMDAAISNIGNIYSEEGDHTKAINCYYQSLAFAIQRNDSVSIADSYLNIGNEYYFQNDLKEASSWYYKAVPIYEQNGIKSQLALCYINIADILDHNKQYEDALKLFEKSLGLLKELKLSNYLSEVYLNIANVNYDIGNYEKAFVNLQLSKNYSDSVYNEDMIAQTSELQTKYETDKKEKENQILKQQNDLQSLNINRQKIISYSVSCGLILVLVLAFYIYRGYKQKKKANQMLERKQIEITVKNNELELANKIIHDKNKDITDSIRYAKRLQTAILKPETTLINYFEDGFIYFRPKDIVSGDFYWFEKFGNLSLLAAADCTGHGVPGAFMSIIGCNLLSQTVNEHAITRPAAILNSVNKGLSKVLQQRDEEGLVKDGMDIALCVFNSDTMMLEYSGAYNPLWLIREGRLIEFKADKFPVGAFLDNRLRIFKNHEIPVRKGDVIYLFSDGYADQFGGPNGKKFKYKALQKLIIENYLKPASVQKIIFEKKFESWMGNLEQVDDVLLMCVKI